MLPGNEDGKGKPPDVKEIVLHMHPIVMEIAQPGSKIPILDRIDNPEEYLGPAEFDVLVNFGGYFRNHDMWNSRVPPDRQWTPTSFPPPPDGITILEFSDPLVKGAVERLSMIARSDFYQDQSLCEDYYRQNEFIFESIASHRHFSRKERNDVKFLGLVRAGVVAGQMLGFEVADQILVQTKRLHLKGQIEGDIAIGITPLDAGRLREIDGKHLIIGDPAGATLSSMAGNLHYLVGHLGIRPKTVNIWHTVVSHRGAELGLSFLQSLGLKGEIVAGGYAPGLNRRYYLENAEGNPSVRDAGNGLDRFLPESLRLLNTSTKSS